MPNFTVVALKCELTAPKIVKNANFWYKFAPKGKSTGAQVEKKLPLWNGIIIVLKITLLHSVSFITNFVIPKRDRQTDKQKTSHFFVYSWRDPRSPPYLAC